MLFLLIVGDNFPRSIFYTLSRFHLLALFGEYISVVLVLFPMFVQGLLACLLHQVIYCLLTLFSAHLVLL